LWYKRIVENYHFNGAAPGIGSLIYLSDGVTPAVPGNLEEFDIDPLLGLIITE
jgi:hypothetical protein